MPNINDIKKLSEDNKSKSFTPKTYRAWNQEPPKTSDTLKPGSTIHDINPEQIRNWVFSDRPEPELGDIASLAKDMKENGQQQACVIRPVSDNNTNIKYELIIGERRWHASKIANISLRCEIKDLSDQQSAIIQATENDQRKDLSMYAKGMSYSKLINANILTQKDLQNKLKKSPQNISRLLSYSKIPKIIHDSISDWSKVTPGTSETIVRLSKKGDDYIQAILTVSDKIQSKRIGEKSLERIIQENLTNDKSTPVNRKVYSSDGRHIFTWRLDNNNLPSIHFPKNINNLFKEGKIKHEELSDDISKILDIKFKSL
ncbi:ParB/RepB/Spo0J family partition protein [Francisellaceae bacterium]|nr:ParB/RepB/Spo0J family partition protein [Francisellaceae bacterium]